MKAKPDFVDTDFDNKLIGDSLKMRFVELDQKYFKKWVQRQVPTSTENLPMQEETLKDNTEDLDKNIDMVFKETTRNELREPQLYPKTDEEKAISRGLAGNQENANSHLSELVTGSISSRLAEERPKLLLRIKEANEDDNDDHDENQDSP